MNSSEIVKTFINFAIEIIKSQRYSNNMAKFELKLPKMGESVAEATITNWLKKVGETIEMDEAVLKLLQIK